MSAGEARKIKGPSLLVGRIGAWIEYRLPIFSYTRRNLLDVPEPRNLNYWWSFGSLSGVLLVLMIGTGLFLAMQYTPNSDLAFDSVQRIVRDVNSGWLLRSLHMSGSSFFFLVVYIHMFRGLYYGSYKRPRELLWMIGVLILALMMGTAFMGYVLPWGQMSFWAATVITNLFSAIPWIGEQVVTWLWGGFSVGNPTLNRFFVLHFLLPFVICAVVFLHLWALHHHGSNNPLGIDLKSPRDTIPFHPYYTIKDIFSLALLAFVFAVFVFFLPDVLSHPDNFIPANPLQTPAHIVPEWYFLPFYAILRSVPDKLLGVCAMFAAVGILALVPFLDRSPVRSGRFRCRAFRLVFWLFILDCLLLGYLGAQPPEGLKLILGRLATAFFFAYFVLFLPLCARHERKHPPRLPASLAEAVSS